MAVKALNRLNISYVLIIHRGFNASKLATLDRAVIKDSLFTFGTPIRFLEKLFVLILHPLFCRK